MPDLEALLDVVTVLALRTFERLESYHVVIFAS